MTSAFAFYNGQTSATVIGQPDFATITSGSGNNKMTFPSQMVFDSLGNLWVTDLSNHRVLKFTAPLTNGMAASAVIGQPDFATVTFGTGNNKMHFPIGIALDPDGNLLVTDSGNHRVLEFIAPLTTGMAASVVIGQPDFTTITSAGGNGGNDKMTNPSGIAIDFSRSLWVADSGNNRILKFLPSAAGTFTTGQTATIVIGQPDFGTIISGSGNDKLNAPSGMSLDGSGNLLVTDTSNRRVLKFTAPLTTGMAATTVIGQPDFTTITSGSGNNKMFNPASSVLDSLGNLWVTDLGNNRVLKFTAPLTTGMAGTTVIGQPDFTTVTSGSGNDKLNAPNGVTLDSLGNLWVVDQSNSRILSFEASTSGSQVTSNVNIVGTCGLSVISGSPIIYGSLLPGGTSTEKTVVLDNTGSIPAILQVKGTNWLDISLLNKMNVDNTKFSTTSGTYATKTSLLTIDQTITAAFSPTTNLNSFWQLQANLLDSSFSGALTQTMDFTASC